MKASNNLVLVYIFVLRIEVVNFATSLHKIAVGVASGAAGSFLSSRFRMNTGSATRNERGTPEVAAQAGRQGSPSFLHY